MSGPVGDMWDFFLPHTRNPTYASPARTRAPPTPTTTPMTIFLSLWESPPELSLFEWVSDKDALGDAVEVGEPADWWAIVLDVTSVIPSLVIVLYTTESVTGFLVLAVDLGKELDVVCNLDDDSSELDDDDEDEDDEGEDDEGEDEKDEDDEDEDELLKLLDTTDDDDGDKLEETIEELLEAVDVVASGVDVDCNTLGDDEEKDVGRDELLLLSACRATRIAGASSSGSGVGVTNSTQSSSSASRYCLFVTLPSTTAAMLYTSDVVVVARWT